MSLRDCLNAAVAQGAISQKQADELHGYYDARFTKNRAQMGEAEARAAARREVSDELRAKAKLKRRNALLAEGVRKTLAEHVTTHRSVYGRKSMLNAALTKMVHFGYGGGSSMKGRENAILSLEMRNLALPMARFRKSVATGMGKNKAELADVVRALWKEGVPSAEVRAMADALRNTLESLRQRFNAAGGDIPKRQYFDIPHTHSARKILAGGTTGRKPNGAPIIDPAKARAEWKAFIRPLLAPERMTNPHTGATIGEAGLDEALDYVFESIVSDGWAHRTPEARRFGLGALSERHKAQRFLEFRSADDWLAYNARFGERDVLSSVFGHIRAMARDIAAMETFGPNPDATVEWMKQLIQAEIGKARAGKSSIIAKLPSMSAGAYAAWRIDGLWRTLRGVDTVSSAPARFADDVRNVATATMLGSTGILAATTDPMIAAAGRALAGLPILRGPQKMVKELAAEFANGEAGRLAALRKGILWEDFLHTMNEEARFVDQMIGHDWSRFLVDRSLTLNALQPLTAARKRLEAMAWHETLGGLAQKNTDWLDMPALLKGAMEGFGIKARHWHVMRMATDEMGFLDPVSVLDKTGDRALAEKYAELIAQWGERQVPAGDPRVKSFITGMLPRGTVMGEIAHFGTQFMSFSMSFTARQMEAVWLMAMQANTRGGRLLRGGAYFAALAGTLTIGAGIYRQIKAVLDGRDPEDMTQPSFWVQSFVQGGGGGIFADFVAASEDRFGHSPAERIAGPGGALIGDTLGLTFGNLIELMRDERNDDGTRKGTNAGREAAQFAGRYTPVLSSHPATRLWYRRMVIDNLQWMFDPKADKSFKAQKRRASYWWVPGEARPRRGPDPATARGG